MKDDKNATLENAIESAKESLREYLTSTGSFRTLEREFILEVALRQQRPFCAKDLVESLREDPRQPSPATIYSSLDLFCRAGILFRFGHNQGMFYFSYFHSDRRMIIVCRECGKVVFQRRTKLFDQFCKVIVPRFYKVRPILLSTGYCSSCHNKLGAPLREEKKKKL